MNMKIIGLKIKAYRESKGFSQADFGKAVFSAYEAPAVRACKVENGYFHNCLIPLLEICNYCHIRLDDFLNEYSVEDCPDQIPEDIIYHAEYRNRSQENFSKNFSRLSEGYNMRSLAHQYQKQYGENLTPNLLYKYRSGSKRPTLKKAYRIAKLMKINVDEFYV